MHFDCFNCWILDPLLWMDYFVWTQLPVRILISCLQVKYRTEFVPSSFWLKLHDLIHCLFLNLLTLSLPAYMRQLFHCLQWYAGRESVNQSKYSLYSTSFSAGHATRVRDPRHDVPLLRLLHRLRIVLHVEPLHRCHHWKLQCTEEKDE